MLAIGVGGLSLQLIDLLKSNFSNDDLLFGVDEQYEVANYFFEVPVTNRPAELQQAIKKDRRFIVLIGDGSERKKWFNKLRDWGGEPVSIIDSSAFISKYATVEPGTIILRNAVIEAESVIKTGTLLNNCAIVHHESNVGSFSTLAPGAILLGNVTIGNEVMIGSGAIVMPKRMVGNSVKIGAGSLVTVDIPDGKVAFGTPARIRNEG